ncbi:MAG: hypothetical protein ACLP59_14370 [Bryobacteraceae bacterium]
MAIFANEANWAFGIKGHWVRFVIFVACRSMAALDGWHKTVFPILGEHGFWRGDADESANALGGKEIFCGSRCYGTTEKTSFVE